MEEHSCFDCKHSQKSAEQAPCNSCGEIFRGDTNNWQPRKPRRKDLQAQLDVANSEIESMHRELEAKAAENEDLFEQLTARDDDIADLQQQLAAKDTIIAEQNRELDIENRALRTKIWLIKWARLE